MDPKALSHLDPKQREAYDRVMGHADGSNPITVSSDPPPSTDPNPPAAIEPNIISANPAAQGITDPTTADPASVSLATGDAGAPNMPSFDPTASGNTAEPQTNFGEPGPIDVSHLDASQSDTGGSSLSNQDGMANFDMPSTEGSEQLSPPKQSESTPSVFSAGPDPASNQTPASGENNSFFSNPSPAEDESQKPSAFDSAAQLGPDQPAPNADPINPSTPVTPYTPQPIGDNQPFTQPLPSPAEVNHGANKETSALLKVLYIVGAVVFFAIYTIFWIKVFNLPFLF